MKSRDQRDLIMSFASNLKIGASIDTVIPDFLRVTAMRLDHHAFKLRRMSRAMSGDGDSKIKTQVRFDNQTEGVVLGVRKGKDGDWEFFPPGKTFPNWGSRRYGRHHRNTNSIG